TAAFVAANPYLSSRFGYAQGFERFEDFLSENLPESSEDIPTDELKSRSRLNQNIARFSHVLGPLGRIYDHLYFEYCQKKANSNHETWDSLRRFPPADVLVDRACDWLASIGTEPFFLWLHFMDPHAPYYPHPEVLKEMGGTSIQPGRG